MDIIFVKKDKEAEIFKNYVSDDIHCAQSVIDNYYWIAEYVISKFAKLGSSTEELEDIAYDTLLTAAADFDANSGISFGLFAFKSIRSRVYETIMDEAMINHRASIVTNTFIKLKSAANVVGNNIKNDSTDWKVAQALGVDEVALFDLIYETPSINRDELSDISKQGLDKLRKTPRFLSKKLLKSASKSFEDIINSSK